MPLRNLFIGIDSGTQSTKALVLDSDTRQVVGEGAARYGLLPNLPPGAKEQNPETWSNAVAKAVKAALKEAHASDSQVAGIGVSGQQHGFVALDADGNVIRPAKLWCDTSTIAECDALTESLGGPSGAIEAVGNAILPGFTAPKILWLKRHEPENFNRLATILLPHDYLNFWLTGERRMEFGDASGTALFDVRQRAWSHTAANAIDSRLLDLLPQVQASDRPAGRLTTAAARRLGLKSGALVSAGGGDNMMGAIGTGNTRPGVVTVSLGTSGAIYAVSESPVIDPAGEIAAFCDSTNRWLPLLCTMNVTVATEMVRENFELDHSGFQRTAAKAPPGCDGLILLPYLEGERTPNVPAGCGVFFGVRPKTFSEPHFARAALEGVTLGLNYGLRRLAQLGVRPTQIRATGGGAKSRLWRQIMADVFQTEVVTLKISEGAALGAGLQALWCWRRERGEDVPIAEITDEWVKLNPTETARPNTANAARYAEAQALQDELSKSLRTVFPMHRAFAS